MKIAILGAGAMGCLYGAYLSRENEVIMLDRKPEKVDGINKKGITVIEEDGSSNDFTNVKAYLSGKCNEIVDLVIVFVKLQRLNMCNAAVDR